MAKMYTYDPGKTAKKQSRTMARDLLSMLSERGTAGFVLVRGDSKVRVPLEFVDVLQGVADVAAQADGLVTVTVDDGDELLTSQEAADLLNVSRPYVVKLAGRGELAPVMVGTHHRFHRSVVAAFADQMRATRDKALRELAAESDYEQGDF